MKKVIVLLTLFFVSLFSQDLQLSLEEQAYIKNHKPITIGMLNNFKPFSFEENSTHQGLSVDILKLISKQTGLQFDIQISNWSTIFKAFKDGEIKMISGISYHKEREKFARFSQAYYEIPIYVFGKKNDSTYNNNNSLIGKKVGISYDMFYKDDLIDMGIRVVEFRSSIEKAKALALGEIDYYLASYTSGLKAINTQFLTSLKPIDEYKSIKKEDLRYGIQKHETILASIITKALKNIDSTTLDSMVNQWIVGLKTPILKNLNFTQEELNYVQQYPVIKVHNEVDWPPYNYFEGGKPIGFSIDYMNLLSSKIGLKVEYVTNTWDKLIKKIQTNDLDIMLNIAKTPAREKYMNFTTPYMTTSSVAFIRNANRKLYKKIEDFAGKKMVVIKGFYQEEYMKANYPNINLVTVEHAVEGLKMVSFGEADGMLLSMAVGEYLNGKYNLANLVPIFEIKESTLNLHMGVRKNNPLLTSILEKGKHQITNEELLALKQKWLINTGVEYENRLNISTKEKIYLKNKKELQLCVNPDFMPYEALQNNHHIGLSADYMNLITKKLQMPIKILPTRNWINTLSLIKSKQCDIVSLSFQTDIVDEYLSQSIPYLRLPLVLATKMDVAFVSSLDQLNDKKIGIINHKAIIKKIKQEHPSLKLMIYDNSKEALKDVVEGDIFGFISSTVDIGYVFQNNFVGQLKIAGKFDDKLDFKMAVLNEHTELLTILNKVIRSISKPTEQAILNNYLSIRYEKGFDYELFWKVVAAIFILILIGVYRHQMLSKVNKALKDLAYKDQLTQLRNRHYFFDVAQSAFALAKRNDDAFCILLIDIDYFKEINDKHGHLIGDEVLKMVANSLQKNIRQSDILARFGGEEFVLALPNTPISGAKKLAENIKDSIESLRYVKNDEESISLTVSIGISDYFKEESLEELIHNSDVALYKAKKEGRNRIDEFIHRYTLNV